VVGILLSSDVCDVIESSSDPVTIFVLHFCRWENRLREGKRPAQDTQQEDGRAEASTWVYWIPKSEL
jgi:hypothetical protein